MRIIKLQPEVQAHSPHKQIAYAEKLNPQQLEVVLAGQGHHLVIAGAGTGKTHTLVYRVAYLIESGIAPEQIVLLTFTRRAAKEMLQRAAQVLDARCERVRGGTFHAFALQLLQQHHAELGYPENFTVMDAQDAQDALDVLRTQKGFHQQKRRFPKKATLAAIYSSCINRQSSISDVLNADYPQFLIFEQEIEALQKDWIAYKKRYGILDCDDILAQGLHLLQAYPAVRERVSAGCRAVLVDEYQDTNRLQADFVALLTEVHQNLMVVGDDAQSIYRFRGADFRNILDFPKQFPNTRIHKLEQNYRSTPQILNLANEVLTQAKEKHEKTLFTKNADGELPVLIQAPDEDFQSRFICQMILANREEGTPLREMAVLVRNSRDAFQLELDLNKRNIPFVKFGGLKFADTAHIRDLLAHIRILENPQDAAAWQRVLLLLEGIGPRTVEEVLLWISTATNPYAVDEAVASPKFQAALRNLVAVIREIRVENPPFEQQVRLLNTYYLPMLARLHPDDQEKRGQDLAHFADIARNFESRKVFLHALFLDPIESTVVDVEGIVEDEKPLVISTIHSAKGLEFQTVFLMQALQGVLPSSYSLKQPEALDEELRLLYVAVTRAKHELYISYPILQVLQGDLSFGKPSDFLANISEKVLEPAKLVESTTPLLGNS